MIKNIVPRLTLLVILFVILFSTQKLEASWKSAQEGNKIILISTIDVYDNFNKKLKKNYNIQHNKNHIYGKNIF